MSKNSRLIQTSRERVWEVLADGWLYPLWVVGTARMRAVDDQWPAVGSRLHHSVGAWPALVDDETVVLDAEPGKALHLRARGWPMGEARVVISLDDDGANTVLSIEEDAVAGPALLIPRWVRTPLLQRRNTEALRRLAALAERR